MSPEVMNEAFKETIPRCNARHSLQFYVNPIHSVYNVTESASYLGPRFGSKYLLKFEIRN